MTIASKLSMASLLLLLISTAFGGSFWLTSQNLQQQRNVNTITQAIIKSSFEFNIITKEYINNKSLRVQTQKTNNQNSLHKLFQQANNTFFFNDDKISLRKIITNQSQVEQILLALTPKENSTAKTRKGLVTNRKNILQIISQVDLRVQGMLSEASKLSTRSLARLTAAEKQLEFTSALLIIIYFLLFLITLVLIQKQVVAAIINLKEKAHQLTLGNYDVRIPVSGKDEISDLSESYNILAHEVQNKITAITDKSKLLSESKKEMAFINDNLQSLIDDQTDGLRNSEIRQRAILESMTDGVVTLDSEYFIKNINPAVENIFGYKRDDVINKRINFIVSDLKNISQQDDLFCEKEGHHNRGHFFPIEISLSRMNINDKFMYTCIVRDITERKRVEKMKDEFVSTVSHELRTPLTSIRGALGLMLSGALNDYPEKSNELLEAASRNTDRLMHLINDILDMQKIEAGKLEFNISQIDLMDAVDKSVIDNMNYATQYNVDIKVGTRVDGATVKVDPLRFAQIMSNLLSNASKFSPEHGSVYIQTNIDGNYAVISVIDNGEGIPQEYFNKIFGKFSQNDSSATREKGGTGLGLAITKQMVEAMGGEIEFTSIVGEGSSFNLHLPIV